jgi:hypothetical protein
MRDLTTRDEVDAMLREDEVVLLKHGASCPISAAARDQMKTFCEDREDVKAYGLEVTGTPRPLGLRGRAARRGARVAAGVRAPRRRPVWRAEHFDIDASGITRRSGQ